MDKVKNLNFEKNLLVGSSTIFKEKKFDRVDFVKKNMHKNFAYLEAIKNLSSKKEIEKILEKFKKKFSDYRKNWTEFPKKMYDSDIKDFNKNNFDDQGPLCVDIETASICDLACPHCFREYILTPDKLMDFEKYKKIIDECVKLGVPSIKLNWRGEPLLNSKIDEYILYAKKRGIIDVAINTNATHLTKEMSEKLINSGLDFMIYSFDGGTKKTYEKMRPGRFKKNNFDKVYKNIVDFNQIKKSSKSIFPLTKIQMVITNDTRKEIDEFFNLFNDHVDDVSISPYSERGGNLDDLGKEEKEKIKKTLKDKNLPLDTPYMITGNGKLSIAKSRRPCEQIFQRLMITYDGRVAMCCMDWGAQHCIGYIDDKAFNIEKTLNDLKAKIDSNKKGFELLKNAKYPKKFNEPEKKISSLKEIWNGKEINNIRNLHKTNSLNDVEICKQCDFKFTYEWEQI